jgi:hypothetical protein
MRSFWLAVIVIAGVLLLVGLRVEGGKRHASKKEKEAAEAAAKKEVATTTAIGYGETKSAARASALREAQDWLRRELSEHLKPEWSFPQQKLDPVVLEEMGVINFAEAKEPVFVDENVKLRAEYEVTLTQKYVDAVTDAARKEYVSEEKGERKDRAMTRQGVVFRVLGGLVVMLLVAAGYLRLEEATRGYYTGLLRAAAVGVVLLAALAFLIIG